MSNSNLKQDNKVPPASSMDEIFGKKPDEIDPTDTLMNAEELVEAFENNPKEESKKTPEKVSASGFQPKQAKVKAADPVIPTEDKVTEARIKALEEEIKKLSRGSNGVKVTPKPENPVPLDFTKISEEDIYAVNTEGEFLIPIEAVEHDLPDYLKVELKDQNYAARWIHKTPRRLGPMLAQGWTYVQKEDLLDTNAVTLSNAIDENGLYRFDDVILCKCPKEKYYGQLRRNQQRTLQRVNPRMAHKVAKQAIEGALNHPENIGVNPVTGRADKSGAGDFSRYKTQNDNYGQHKIEVYEPLAK